jgi:hypothetical protein
MNYLLTSADRLTSKLGFLNTVLDAIVEAVVPHKPAHAACCIVLCHSQTVTCTTGCRTYQTCAVQRGLCSSDTWTCTTACQVC